jgi:hypothetical protein
MTVWKGTEGPWMDRRHPLLDLVDPRTPDEKRTYEVLVVDRENGIVTIGEEVSRSHELRPRPRNRKERRAEASMRRKGRA